MYFPLLYFWIASNYFVYKYFDKLCKLDKVKLHELSNLLRKVLPKLIFKTLKLPLSILLLIKKAV